jgi:prevent-host-death family protein
MVIRENVLQVSVAELKAHLSPYLRMVRAGQDVIVTDRGVPVARLCPVGPVLPDARTTALYRAGLARPPRRALPADFWERQGRPTPGAGRWLPCWRNGPRDNDAFLPLCVEGPASPTVRALLPEVLSGVLIDPRFEKVLGCSVVGPHSGYPRLFIVPPSLL